MSKLKKFVIVASFILIVVLLSILFWLSRPKPPFRDMPFSPEDFEGYPSGVTIDRSKGEWDEPNIYLASYVSNDEVFLGLKICILGYNIHNFSHDETVRMQVKALAFLKNSGFEPDELKFSAEYNPERQEEVYPLAVVKEYNLDVAYKVPFPSPSKPLLICEGVGYNETGFEAEGPDYRLYDINVDHELFLTLTLSYSSGLLMKEHNTISTSIYMAVKGVILE